MTTLSTVFGNEERQRFTVEREERGKEAVLVGLPGVGDHGAGTGRVVGRDRGGDLGGGGGGGVSGGVDGGVEDGGGGGE
jgi:hypothetical protein